MATQPFTWGFGGQAITSPEQAARKRAVAEALMAQSATPGQNWSEGLADVAAALSGTVLEGRVSEAEAAGRERAGGLFADLAVNASPDSIIAALTSSDAQWASPAQTSIASALLNSGLERADPMYQAQLAQLTAPKQPDYPTSVQEYLYAQSDPAFAAWQAENGGGQTINVGGNNDIGTIPPGMMVQRDANGNVIGMSPIPGGPAEAEAQAAALAAQNAGAMEQQGADIVSTDIGRAINILDTPGMLPTSGFGADWVSSVGGTGGADLRNLLNTVKANVAFDTLSQMRAASPTGGALGAVSERELSLLESAKGALDQSQSPQQLRDNLIRLQNLTLDVVHGKGQGPERLRPSYEKSTIPGVTIRRLD